MFKLHCALLALLIAAPMLPAHATMPTATLKAGKPTAIVDTRWLNIASAAGRKKLGHRLASAVEAVCGSYANATPDEQGVIARCRRDAIADIAPKAAAIVAQFGSGTGAIAAS